MKVQLTVTVKVQFNTQLTITIRGRRHDLRVRDSGYKTMLRAKLADLFFVFTRTCGVVDCGIMR